MNAQHFSLQPFPTTSPQADLEIVGTIARHANKLAIRYSLLGNLAGVALTSPSDTPTRKQELWQETCFEFFLGIQNSPRYWEFNLSSAGHWNVYRFTDYRQGMQEELAFSSLPFIVQSESDALSLPLDLDLDAIVSAEQSLDVAITTVIKHSGGELTYWALTHSGSEADFHRRDSFIIELPGWTV